MRAVVYNGESACYTEEQPIPVPADDESLIRVQLAAICNTDREILRGYRPDFRGVMGHEFCGVVEASRDSSLVGRQVVGEINLSCGECFYCTSSRPNHCLARRCLGISEKDGAFADYLTLPNRLLHLVPEGISPEVAVFTEPLAAALRIVEQVNIANDTPVALVGDGRLALMIAQALAATCNARITVYGRHAEKLRQFAPYSDAQIRTATPADATQDGTAKKADATQDGTADQAECSHTSIAGDSYELVIDATGSPQSLRESIRITRSGATLVVKSTYAGLTEIDVSEIVVREITLIGSRCGPFNKALSLLEAGSVCLPPLELFAPVNFATAFASDAFKAALDFRV
jgi:threonine dehydrogenase-like Zn-dependent dehydrogenase